MTGLIRNMGIVCCVCALVCFAAPQVYAQTTYYVDTDVASSGVGTTWDMAFKAIPEAVSAASSGDEIWVAEGTYTGNAGTAAWIENVVIMKAGVALYGGFDGTENARSARDWVAHRTTIDAEDAPERRGVYGANGTLDGFTITRGNADPTNAGYEGAGMYNSASSPTVANCSFSNNASEAMYNSSSSPAVTNCTFASSTAIGMSNTSSSPTVTNCSFSNNGWRGMYNFNSSPTVTNCILWGPNDQIINVGSSTPTVTYSDVQQTTGTYTGTGNKNEDPMFVNAGTGDLHLQSGSPCINTGTNSGAPATDFDGEDRPFNTTTDMGADEWVDTDGDGQSDHEDTDDDNDGYSDVFETAAGTDPLVNSSTPLAMFVDVDAGLGNNDGTSWDDAFTAIQTAVAASVAGGEIWVAQGTYTGNAGTQGDSENVVIMKAGVALYGGFDGTESARSARDWANNTTTIDGEDTAGRRCVYGANNATLDGFTITGGNANSGGEGSNGGGMYNTSASPTVMNCTFAANTGYLGGGMCNYSCSPALTNCTFSGNDALFYAGGMCNDSASPTVTNCIFSDNTATFNGGGMYNTSASCSPTLTNCTFSGNLAGLDGGGMFNGASCSPTLTNCILWGSNDQIYNDASTPVVTYSDVQQALGTYTGTGNINEDPLFVNAGTGDFHLQSGSPCIDTGTNSGAPASDFDGQSRPLGAGYEMGVDEFVDTTPPVIVLTGDSVLTMDCNGPAYVEPGYTATDDVDDDITGDVLVGGDTVDVDIPDDYTITYDVNDSSGNPALQVTRTVTVLHNCGVLTVTPVGDTLIEATEGDTVSMQVQVSGNNGPVHYAWYFEDGTKAAISVGNDSDTLLLEDVVMADEGPYFCDVSDDFDTVRSASFELIVSTSLPVGGGVSLGLLAAAAALAGALALRRRDRHE